MKYLLGLLVLSLTVISLAAQSGDQSSALENLVNIERSFARLSHEKGTREAFLTFIADDGILFRPTAVNGRSWLLANPPPASTKRPLLSWAPIYADIAIAGDMGYTTGPWEFKEDIKDPKPSGHGQFVTVWKKQANGTWKFVVDLGTSNPPPPAPASQWQVSPKGQKAGNVEPSKVNRAALRNELVKRDWEFSQSNTTKTLILYAADDVRLFRENKFPLIGREEAKKALEVEKNRWTSQPDFADISSSGDLAYTYGTYEMKGKDGKATVEKGNYLRIWKQQGAEWKIALDLANPVPEKRNGTR